MGFSYSTLFMEVIICTPATSGLLEDDICQKSALAESSQGSKRGRVQGDAPKTNLKQKQKKFNSISEACKTSLKNTTGSQSSFVNNLLFLSRPLWVGGFVALGFAASLFISAPQAHAASNGWGTLSLAKEVVASATPALVDGQATDQVQTADQSDDFIEKPLVVETEITPPEPSKQVLAATYRADYSLVSGPHYFPYGYCTYYVSQKRTIPWTGNAGTWLSGAKASGFATGEEPKVGAIMVTAESRVGHVAYVESVDGDEFTVSEMNFKGYGIVSTRTLSTDYKAIKGFIY